MKCFNTTAVCIPSKHYMVDTSGMVREIKRLVDEGKYFTINRARQYGKTTTLNALSQTLKGQYAVVATSFEGIGNAGFQDEETFVREFCRLLRREFRRGGDVPLRISEEDEIVQMQMYGLIRNEQSTVRIANRVFETLLYNLFFSEEETPGIC